MCFCICLCLSGWAGRQKRAQIFHMCFRRSDCMYLCLCHFLPVSPSLSVLLRLLCSLSFSYWLLVTAVIDGFFATVCLPACLSACLFVCPSVCLPACQSLCQSVLSPSRLLTTALFFIFISVDIKISETKAGKHNKSHFSFVDNKWDDRLKSTELRRLHRSSTDKEPLEYRIRWSAIIGS